MKWMATSWGRGVIVLVFEPLGQLKLLEDGCEFIAGKHFGQSERISSE